MEIKEIYRSLVKPCVDFVLAFGFIVVLSPLFLLIAIILICQRKPVFFVHYRPGLNEGLIRVYKFTSMVKGNAEIPFWFGKLLRKTSLDELPQLFNVLRGDMSLVGPRPLLIEYLEDYTVEQRRRHSVKPGITGWAQVNGRNAISQNEKLNYDLHYVDNLSFSLDLKILFKTFRQLLKANEADYHHVSTPLPPVSKIH